MSTLLLASFQAALLALAVLLLERTAGRGLGPGLRLALWSLVPLRLLLVVPLADPFQAARPDWWTWKAPAAAAELSAAVPRDPAFRGAPVRLQREEPGSSTAPTQPDAATPAHEAAPPTGSSALPASPSAPFPTPAARQPEATAPQAADPIPADRLPWLWLLWAAGFAVVLSRALLAELRLRRDLRRRAQPAPAALQELAQNCAARLGLRGPVPVRLVAGLPSPAAHGWWRGQLLLPADFTNQLDEEQQGFVLLHELAHLRHRDALQNLGLALLQAVHWFNPLVAHAHHRIREERELLRDREALAALPTVSPRRCAETLVQLLPRQQAPPSPTSLSALLPPHQTTRRRIAMILHQARPRRLQLLPGIACLLILGWAGLTQTHAQSGGPVGPARPNAPSTGAVPAGSTGPSRIQEVRVTRQTPEPAWLAPTRARLEQQTLQWEEPIELDDLVQMIQAVTNLQVRIAEDLFGAFDEVGAMRVPVTIDRALDLLAEVYPMRWNIEDGGIRLGDMYSAPDDVELRFYDVQQLVGDDEDRGDHLLDVLHDLTHHGEVWDWQEVGMRLWNGQLLVQQSPHVHQRIETVLNMLLQRHSAPFRTIPPEHRALFLQRVSVKEGQSIDAFLGETFAAAGIPLLIHPDFAGMEFENDSENIPFHALLEQIRRNMGGSFTYHEGVEYFGERVPMSTACYDISDLVQPSAEEVEESLEEDGFGGVTGSERERRVADAQADLRERKSEHLMDLLNDMISPEFWEVDGPSMLVWDGLLLITQSQRAHTEIASFLETARRAVRR